MTPLAPIIGLLISLYLIAVSAALLVSDILSQPQILDRTLVIGGGVDFAALMFAVSVQRVYHKVVTRLSRHS